MSATPSKELLRLCHGLVETGDADRPPAEAARVQGIRLDNKHFHEPLAGVPTNQACLNRRQAGV